MTCIFTKVLVTISLVFICRFQELASQGRQRGENKGTGIHKDPTKVVGARGSSGLQAIKCKVTIVLFLGEKSEPEKSEPGCLSGGAICRL